MLRILIPFLCFALAGCGERQKEYGWAFLLYCSQPTSSYSTDKNGRVIKLYPSIVTSMFVPYSGGMFEDGKHVPMDFSAITNCTLIKGWPTDNASWLALDTSQ